MWLGGFWQECISRSKSSVTRALMQTLEAGSWWRSQVVCRGTHSARRNNVRLSRPGAPCTPVKTRETSQDSQSQQHKEDVKKDYHSVDRGAQDTMTQGPQLIFSVKRPRKPCSSTCAPSWRISWRRWWQPEKLSVFSPGHFCTRSWNLPKETVGTDQTNCKTWHWTFPRSCCSSLH